VSRTVARLGFVRPIHWWVKTAYWHNVCGLACILRLRPVLTEHYRFWFSNLEWRPVRPVRSQRLAATDSIQSKAVNRVRFLDKMLMFSTEKTKTDVAHILVLTHTLVLSCQQSGMLTVCMFSPCCHWPNMPKTQPLDLDDVLSWGEKNSKNLYVQIEYRGYEMSNPIHRANLLYRLPQFFIAQKRVKTRSNKVNRYAKICCWNACKKD